MRTILFSPILACRLVKADILYGYGIAARIVCRQLADSTIEIEYNIPPYDDRDRHLNHFMLELEKH